LARLLVVEDDPSIRAVLVEFLILEGYDALEAHNPESARKALEQQRVDLVITDTYEPTWNPTLPWLDQIRDAAGSAKLVLLTAYSEAQTLDAAKHGLSAIWTKPMDMDDLLRNVQKLLDDGPP
jgi:twitching motility two-component system response regulator PilH